MTLFKPLFRIAPISSALFLTCTLAISVASAQGAPVYIGSSASGTLPLAAHPGTLGVSIDCEIHGIRWTHWAASTTTGRGTFLCGTGVSSSGARLVASHPIRCGGHEVYSRLAFGTKADVTPAGKPFMTPVPFKKSVCEFTTEG
jgi:hypothetical protein